MGAAGGHRRAPKKRSSTPDAVILEVRVGLQAYRFAAGDAYRTRETRVRVPAPLGGVAQQERAPFLLSAQGSGQCLPKVAFIQI